MKIGEPLNKIQERFNVLCDIGGGKKSGPEKQAVQALLKEGGEILNNLGHTEICKYLEIFPHRNPWHICFAMGLSWGHLAKDDPTYMDAATRALANLNETDIATARKFHYERGERPVDQSLRGGFQMFQLVRLPNTLPDSLEGYDRAQQRWMSPLVSPSIAKPKYIGSWNATAMFMIGIFSQPNLWPKFTSSIVSLPPNGPVYQAMRILHTCGILSNAPVGSSLDDSAYDPGAIFENNSIITDLIDENSGLNMIDLHSGLYMLGTRFKGSSQWA